MRLIWGRRKRILPHKTLHKNIRQFATSELFLGMSRRFSWDSVSLLSIERDMALDVILLICLEVLVNTWILCEYRLYYYNACSKNNINYWAVSAYFSIY